MLPSLSLLRKIPQQILSIPNQRKESKRKEHYSLFLLCYEAGLRVSEAINFDLNSETQKGLYKITKTKGQKKRFVYIPQEVINELKKHNWKPQQTNRFNFYHFLKKIKKELGISQNIELTPHTLRRAFTTYHAENGLPLPLLSKLLGHQSVRTTALYWMNIYQGNDDDDSDTGAILIGKNWLEKQEPDGPDSELPLINEIPSRPEITSQLTANLLAEQEINQVLRQQLSEKDEKIEQLQRELSRSQEQNIDLRQNSKDLNEQNSTLRQELTQASTKQEQISSEKDQTIKQLEQKLANERAKRIAAQNNLTHEKQINHTLRETNTNLTQKLHAYEQNYTNLTNAYQNAIKDKEKSQKQANYYETQLKSIARTLHQWQKLNYYQQLEKEQRKMEAQILQPPPWKPNK